MPKRPNRSVHRLNLARLHWESTTMTVARILLGAVLLWFGVSEIRSPALWTGYVPLVSPTSGLAVDLVAAHGVILFLMAVALIFGIAPRISAMLAALLLLEIFVSLIASHGLNDIAMRDLGVLGLALAVAGSHSQRWVLTR